MRYKFQAVGKKAAIIPDEPEKKTPGGVLLPDTMEQRPHIGIVDSIGKKVTEFKAGDVVAYSMYAGSLLVMPDKTEYWLLSEEDVFGVLTAEDEKVEASADGRTEIESDGGDHTDQ